MDTNFFAPIHVTRAVLDYMKKQQYGRIININSVHGLTVSSRKSAYCSAKHALTALTEIIALEYKKYGITSNQIAPGFVDTDMVVRQIQRIKDKYPNLSGDSDVIKKLSNDRQEKLISTQTITELVLTLVQSNRTGETIEV